MYLVEYDRSALIRWEKKATNKEIRQTFRLLERDLTKHAGRICLVGSNQPLKMFGGPWVLPTNRPISLRPMLSREAYHRFACEVNEAVAWNVWSWDTVTAACACLLSPAGSHWKLVSIRYCNMS